MNNSHSLISDAYSQYYRNLVRFFSSHINDNETAEDLTQDVFVHLYEWKREIDSKGIRNLIFKIARNILCDYLRRIYLMREYDSHVEKSKLLYDTSAESSIIAADLFRMECRIIAGLSPQRKKAYILKRFDGKSAAEIAETLGISRRTAENHIFKGVKTVRDIMAKCC